MTPRFLAHLMSIVAALGLTAEPVPPKVSPFPELPSLPAPLTPATPKADPTAVSKLTAELIYVVQSDAPFLLFASPPDLVTIVKEAGPIRLRGKFIDGSGRVETRTITAKNIAIVEAVAGKSGRVELIFVPIAPDVNEATATRRMVDVNTAPTPPPKPEPDVAPKPKPVVPVAVTSFRVVMVFESADTLTAAQHSVLYGVKVEEWLTANCTGGKAGWRRRDKDLGAGDNPAIAAIWNAVKPEFAAPKNTKTPAVAVQVNERIELIPLDATPEAMIATLAKYKGGK